jgi:hypothetical protein
MGNSPTLHDKLDTLAETITELKEQYQLDMHGDSDVSNGNPGIVGTIRAIRKELRDYPSLAYLFAHKPFRVIGAAMAIFAFLMALWTAGLYGLGVKLLGLPWPLTGIGG